MVQTEHESHARNTCNPQIRRKFHLEMAGNIARIYQNDIDSKIVYKIVNFYNYFCFTENSEETNVWSMHLVQKNFFKSVTEFLKIESRKKLVYIQDRKIDKIK